MTIYRYKGAKESLEASYERLRARIPGAESREVMTRYGQTHVLVAGRADAPPVVLLHGALTGSAHIMSGVTPLLDHFRVYAPDILGHSVKSADRHMPSFDGDGVGEWVADVMDGLRVAKAHIHGTSLGGFIARKFAEYAPERVDRLVLLVPAGIFVDSVWGIMSRFMIPMLTYRAFPNRERLHRFMGVMMTDQDEEFIEIMGEAFRGFKQDPRMPPVASRESFAGPTLVIGASDDVFFPGKELLARAKEIFARLETELLEGVRHVPPMDVASQAQHCDRVARFLGADLTISNAA